MPRIQRNLLPSIFLLLLTIGAYFPVLKANFIWDDDQFLTQNPVLVEPGGFRDIWLKPGATFQYYPLLYTSFLIEHRLWGLNPVGYHVNNILLHGLSAILLWVFLKKINMPGAWFAAALFALHPVHVESVAWVSERKNTLSGLFFFLALGAYGKFSNGFKVVARTHIENQRLWYVTSLLLFLAALFSKTTVCLMPVSILILYWVRSKRFRWSNDFLFLVPFFILGWMFSRFTVLMELEIVGADQLSWNISFLQKCEIAGRALWFYLGKLVWPHPLIFSYPKWVLSEVVWENLIPGILFFILISIAWAGVRRWGKGPVAGLLWFGALLFPALGFFAVYPFRFSFVADHFQYLASVGPICVIAASIGSLRFNKWRQTIKIGVLVVCAVLTWKQTQIYRDAETIWRDTLRKNTESWLAAANLGVISLEKGNILDAELFFSESLKREPKNFNAHAGLGVALAMQGKNVDALRCFEEAIRLEPKFLPAVHLREDLLLKMNK